ncbi:hypothetical protein Dsin_014067 [Dipteronia sinensis]|uniref:Uncharacterized protein n=1 Tax=Dipteronia sinensis TaxID=43782 RepID=A0AAE0ALI5_9ROSI|nr:hypothetical protein Dsin_014067 [Dipteronia sinensis]
MARTVWQLSIAYLFVITVLKRESSVQAHVIVPVELDLTEQASASRRRDNHSVKQSMVLLAEVIKKDRLMQSSYCMMIMVKNLRSIASRKSVISWLFQVPLRHAFRDIRRLLELMPKTRVQLLTHRSLKRQLTLKKSSK